MGSDREKLLESLLRRAYDHLNYCGWGDSWERECSSDLRKELDEIYIHNRKLYVGELDENIDKTN
jgi:hypothetical protein